MNGERIEVLVNGQPRAVDGGTTLAALLEGLGAPGVAVARNGEVVPRGEWPATVLADRDRLEIVRAVQGG